MGWCPQEDDKEQNERLERNFPSCGCPPNDGWKCASNSADHDVLRRGALQPYRVDDDIEKYRGGEQRPRRYVEDKGKKGNSTPAKCETKSECLSPRDFVARDRTRGRARHERIDIGVIPHVEHTGGASSRGDGQNCSGPKKGIEATWCNHQPNYGSKYR